MKLLDNLCNRLQNAGRPVASPVDNTVAIYEPVPGSTSILPVDFVSSIVNTQDRTPEARRVSTDGYIHVSSLIGLCSRQQVLSMRDNKPLSRSVTGGHQIMWKIGRAVESHIREQFIKGHGDSVFGRWSCACGSTHLVSTGVPKCNCEVCEGILNNYKELVLLDQNAGVIGSPDLLFSYASQLVPVEIKSMNKKDFDALERPLGDHIFQVCFYRYLLGENGYAVHDKVSIVYCTKEFKFGNPYKEFHVDATTQANRTLVNSAVMQAIEIKVHLLNNTLPDRTVCSEHTCTRAKNCPSVTQCFSAP